MFISIEQLRRSLHAIEDVHPFFGISFLAFKRAEIPVGSTQFVNFSAAADEILEQFYRPTSAFDGFYQPLKTGNKKGRWVSRRYGSTSLQRITKDTFGDSLIHPPGTSDWGWQSDYLISLGRWVAKRKLPAFHLAAWLFRSFDRSEDITPQKLIELFFRFFKITNEERAVLFDDDLPKKSQPWLQPQVISEREMFEIIGFPPGYSPPEGVSLKSLELHETGPAKDFRYEPSERLNIITGDNGLGKTFILECVWWALTGRWSDGPILPRRDGSEGQIKYQLAVGAHALEPTECYFLRQEQRWDRPPDYYVPGVVIYSRFDGSFSILDPARIRPELGPNTTPGPLLFNRNQIWHGLQYRDRNKTRTLCNGLIDDWVLWQRASSQYEKQFGALTSSLRILSPNREEHLILGNPIRLPGDASEIPTLAMPYGEVPVTQASAGIQRVITLAYMLVWTWFEHVANSEILGKPPQKRLVLIIDEVEAHLHPRWQRVLVPGIMEVVKELWKEVTAQVHIATHSPLVMASAETIFDASLDDLHHLDMIDGKVKLGELHFVKRGTVDAWLMSDAFGLDFARSVPGEEAIKEAMNLQKAQNVAADDVRKVHEKLVQVLAEDDRFWPRWRSFSLKHGVDE